MCEFINVSAVKKLVKANGKRSGDDFITALDARVRAQIEKACSVHNGGAKTLTEAVLNCAGAPKVAESGNATKAAIKEARNEAVEIQFKINEYGREDVLRGVRRIMELLK